MNNLLLHARNVVVVVVLSAMLTNASAQVQRRAQSRSHRSGRTVERTQPLSPVTAEQRRAKLNCERFMHRHRSIINVQFTERTRQFLCSSERGMDIFSRAEQVASLEQCLSFLTPYHTYSFNYCYEESLVQAYSHTDERRSFEQCIQNVSARLGAQSAPRDSRIILSIDPHANGRRADIVAACMISVRMKYENIDVQNYEACTRFLMTNNMLGDSAFSSFYSCTVQPLLSVFNEPSLLSLYIECVNASGGVVGLDGSSAWGARYCTDTMYNYIHYVHGNAAHEQAYNVCRSLGSSYGACLDGARDDYYRRNPLPESQPAAGAED